MLVSAYLTHFRLILSFYTPESYYKKSRSKFYFELNKALFLKQKDDNIIKHCTKNEVFH